jgi:hypothetical protein
MKVVYLIFTILVYLILPSEEVRLNGRYFMQYEEKYISENCQIIFNDSVYKKRLGNGKIVKGSIEYEKFVVVLKDKENNLQMSFLKEELLNDTIYFATKNIKDKPVNGMEISISAGKLIKVK